MVYVQECVPEQLELKRSVWAQIDALLADDCDAILASSTSCIVPSKISDTLKHRDNFIVAHPVSNDWRDPTGRFSMKLMLSEEGYVTQRNDR